MWFSLALSVLAAAAGVVPASSATADTIVAGLTGACLEGVQDAVQKTITAAVDNGARGIQAELRQMSGKVRAAQEEALGAGVTKLRNGQQAIETSLRQLQQHGSTTAEQQK